MTVNVIGKWCAYPGAYWLVGCLSRGIHVAQFNSPFLEPLCLRGKLITEKALLFNLVEYERGRKRTQISN